MPELFYFVHKRTLFFGLNLVGGKMTDYEFYFNKFRYEFEVVKSMIDKYVVAGNAVNVVIFGHAFPKDIHHRSFFEPLRDYIDRKLKNKVPILYLNGDKHVSGSVGEYAKFIFMCTDCPMIRNCSSTSLRRTTWANQTSIDCKWTLVQFTHPWKWRLQRHTLQSGMPRRPFGMTECYHWCYESSIILYHL